MHDQHRLHPRPRMSLAHRMLAIALTASSLAAGTALAANSSGVGINVGGWDYWSPDLPTIDQFKRAEGWFTQCTKANSPNCPGETAWDTGEQSALQRDANGWPLALPAPGSPLKFRSVAALLFKGNGGAHPVGRYIVRYDGQGTLAYGLRARKLADESREQRDVIEVAPGDEGVLISITATAAGNHLRNIRVVPPGGVCELEPKAYAETPGACAARGTGPFVGFEQLVDTQTFHPYFLADIRGFRSVRFLDWNRTNTSQLTDWAQRPKPAHAFWTGPHGVPVEAMLELANRAGSDPWINMPYQASDDYVRRFAQLARQRLGAKRQLIVEYANEAWNGGFVAGGWMQQQALRKWPAADGTSDFAKRLSWYGLRSAQVCAIVKAEFGADAGRVRCAVNSQAANADVLDQILQCRHALSERGGQPCARGVDAAAIAPYFADYIADDAVRATVRGWAAETDGGLGKMFAEILAEGPDGRPVTPPLYASYPVAPQGAVALARQRMLENLRIANRHGLPLWAYEGGQHLSAFGAADPVFVGLYTRANRDPRMGRAYDRMLQNWRADNGQLIALFNHVYMPGRHGAWGLKETLFTTEGAKWNAVLPWRDGVPCWWSGCTR